MKLRKHHITLMLLVIVFGSMVYLIGSDFHFSSSYTPIKMFWVCLLLLSIIIYQLNEVRRDKILTLTISSVGLIVFALGAWLFGTLFFGLKSEVATIDCECNNKKYTHYFHQRLWGGTPYITIGTGDTYLGGSIYTMDSDTTIHAEHDFAKDIDSNIVLPDFVDSNDLIFAWPEEHILIRTVQGGKKSCIPLNYK